MNYLFNNLKGCLNMATEFLGLKSQDIVNCTKNFGTTIGIGLTSAATAVTVDWILSKLAIKIFNIDQEGSIRQGISFIAFAAGCATTFYLAPQMSLISFVTQKTFTLIALDALLVG